MRTSMVEKLHRLTAVWGPSGREQKIASVLEEAIRPHVDQVEMDRFGNLLAIRRGAEGSKRVMLAAHMDTIGAVANQVNDKGLVHVSSVGGMKPYHGIGQRVIWSSGTWGILQHEAVDESKDVDFKKMWVDVGASSQEEALGHVRPGDMCVFTGPIQALGDLAVGPGLDNRLGCAVLLSVAEALAGADREHEVVFAFTAQGKARGRGAGAAAYGVDPDAAVVVDLIPTGDVPGGPRSDVKLGHGPVLRLKDGGYVPHQGLRERVEQIAGAHEMGLQLAVCPSTTTDREAQAILSAREGVPTVAVDIPVRYRGTAGEMANLLDAQAAVNLLVRILQDPLNRV